MSEITAGEKHFFYDENQGENLLNLLLAQKLLVDNPCSGKGVCGKCRVRVVSGKLPPPCETEKQLLGQEELNRGIRLACTVIPKGDLQIELLHKERKHKILSDGYVPEFAFRPAVRKQRIYLEKASLEAQTPAAQQIRQQTGVRRIAYEALKSFAFEPGEYTAVIAGGNPEQSAVMAGNPELSAAM
ncbi:MAG: 2Fe-2S iron-sulfur cluster-binding protein, partial [Lachnospiraceae bacterium]|nr:2Fe-2S iron-sulfur cluster-binding protein [Lachnospiraceae bacterium]